MKVIPSSVVGMKINAWYNEIQKLDVIEAERLKEEVRQEIEYMEEDQDTLLYYQLMGFRHQLMLDYLYPNEKKMSLADYLREIEGQGRKFSGLLEYYFSFFSGMYYFSEGKYLTAIQSYRLAEKRLSKISDKIEKAEFYFRMGEVFYHMKQTHMSMYYISLAYEIYKKQATYMVRRIQCHFVIAGNYDDLHIHDKALPHLHKALALSQEIDNWPMITKSLINMANCYQRIGSFQAVPYLLEAIKATEKTGSKDITLAYYLLALIHFIDDKKAEAEKWFKQAIDSAQKFDDSLSLILLNFLEVLFIKQGDRSEVLESLEPLRNNQGYPYLEELAFVAAEFYTKNRRPDDSVFFLKQMMEAQNQIRRGEFQYEI
ncbi:Rap family tetratricopeptide repeat protein [Bacillus changyiensis]|uniref:Rap family tetratricopeptide repeat protein n=1 Tax=Bacillus changyiensis TaxID=3004103 RepID=UPI0022E1B626|nr:Rap family tetratricopeptide repeat protein [Bacillus changyiensis]MDA1475151.1 aspartate phosphatase [Bacillus changyiensis]